MLLSGHLVFVDIDRSKIQTKMSSESNPVIISPVGYAKILMHCLKYPHATVNGLLLVKTSSTSSGTSLSQRSSGEGNRVVSESDDTTTNSVGTCSPESSSPSSAVEIVDVVPLFHLGHGLSPMMEVALLQVTNQFLSFFSFSLSLSSSLILLPSSSASFYHLSFPFSLSSHYNFSVPLYPFHCPIGFM